MAGVRGLKPANKRHWNVSTRNSNSRIVCRRFDSNSFSLLDGASGTPQKSNPQNAITQSQEANREVSQLLNDFYSTPKTDPQVEELKRQVEELESRLETKPQTPPDPMEIAEKQYALAAKYFNNGEQRAEPARNSASKTVTVHPVRSLGEGVVTTLATVEPDSLLSELGRERNLGFNTAVGSNTQANHRGIRVCVDEDQTISSGDRIRLRLTEPIRVNDCQIDAGSASIRYGGYQRTAITDCRVEHRTGW